MRLRGSASRSTGLVTALDIIVIISVALCVVMLLGVRGRFSLGTVVTTVRDPLRPLLLAALAAAIRWYVGRRQPILPSLPRSAIQSTLDAERSTIVRPTSSFGTVKYYAVAAMAASLLWLTPHLANIRHVPDHGDPLFSAWRLARFAHQLTNDPANLFDGNIYHPSRHTLTYSDPTVLEGFVAFPFIAAGADPLVVSNILFLASFPLSAFAFFYTAWRLTSDPRAACIAGILGGLAVFKIEHYSHLELQFLFFAPLAVLFLLRMVAEPSWRAGAWLGATVTGQWLASMYLGVMLAIFLVPIAVLAAVAWRPRPTRAMAAALATCAAIVIAGGSITAVPFLRSESERGGRKIQEVRFFSATPGSYNDRHRYLATYRPFGDRSQNRAECELFPGSVPLVLGAFGLAPPAALVTVALTAASAIAFDGSLGTNGLIYDELFRYVRPFAGMRVPARFAALVTTGLILVSGYGARRVLNLAPAGVTRRVVFGGLAVAALIDLRSSVPLVPYPKAIPGIYSAVSPDMVLAELPMADNANFHYMYFSTFHWARLINGQSGHFPGPYITLVEDMQQFPTEKLMTRLGQRGATHITVNCALFTHPPDCRTLLQKIDAEPKLQMVSRGVWEGAEVRLYRIVN